MDFEITHSVGARSRGAVNDADDVRAVQTLLQSVADALDERAYHPGPIDGAIGSDARSPTVRAIRAFQRRFLRRPDGVVDPGGRTHRRLVAAHAMGQTADAVFPFRALPPRKWHWTRGMRRFGAGRRNGRAHAGCDLYAPEGTPIHAVADGEVVRAPYDFYAKTDAVEVDHGAFVVRYGEIMKGNGLRLGDRVEKGQPIAMVGHLVGLRLPSDMLHIELYDKTATGPLGQGKATSARHTNGWPFLRRRDLVDPTPFLNRWQASLPA